MNHKTQEQSYFYEVQGNHVVECEDYSYLGFHAMLSRRSALLKDLLSPSSGQEIPRKPHKLARSSGYKPCS